MKKMLTAEWTNLVAATYEVDKKLLEKFLPCNTELNDWNGKYLVSLVGFMFSNTTLMGIKAPLFKSFPEINLRFYVKWKNKNAWVPGVVFIKEISPSAIIGLAAKILYRENFISLPMRYKVAATHNNKYAAYEWKINNQWNYLRLTSAAQPIGLDDNNIETFICNNYTAFTKPGNNKTLMFQIKHQPWQVYAALDFDSSIHTKLFEKEGFSDVFQQKPLISFLMDGSFTEVSKPVLL